MQDFARKILSQPGRAGGIIEIPIQHGKTTYFSHWLPAWHAMSFPDTKIILAGYGDDFASTWGEAVRKTFKAWSSHLAGLTITNDHQKKQDWTIASHRGGMKAVGTGGAITGFGAGLLICDDLVKDRKHADSLLERDNLWKWFTSDCYSRLANDGKAFIVMSRRNQDDLTGRLIRAMEDGGDHWHVLRVPALCDDPANDPLNRKLGEALDPNRYTAERLNEIKTNLEISGQAATWECLYQQNPVGDPAASAWPIEYFKDVIYDHEPFADKSKVAMRILTLDPSKGRGSKTSDFASFSDVCIDFNNHWWVRPHAKVMPIDQIEEMGINILRDAASGIDGFKQVPFNLFAIENNDSFHYLAANIAKRVAKEGILVPVAGFPSTEKKQVRIVRDLSGLLSQGRIHIDRKAPGARTLLSQLQQFPTGKDDCPDSLSMVKRIRDYLLKPQSDPGVQLILTPT